MSPGAVVPKAEGSNLRSVEQLARLLWRRRFFIAVCGVVLGAVAFLATKQLPKRYTSTGLVAVDTQRFTVPELQGVVAVDNLMDMSPQVRSETLLLGSPALLRKVADNLDLAKDPEFNPLLQPPGLIDHAKDLVRSAARGEFLPQPVLERLADWGITLPDDAASKPMTPRDVRELVIASLKGDLAVFNDARSLIISVSFTSEKPEKSAQILNNLFETYLNEKREVRASRNREGLAALQARLEEARIELAAAEQRVRDFRARHGIVTVRAGSVSQQQVEDLTTALARASDERARTTANWEHAQAMARRGTVATETVDALTSGTVSRMQIGRA